ncbi:hypothetical protein TNCV_1126021 [Trichonephila clavipes]|nr:hypothetical protein TNCV_1126021 [Trichonephila clavipes]
MSYHWTETGRLGKSENRSLYGSKRCCHYEILARMEDKARLHAARVAMKCLTVSNTSLASQIARSFFNRACLGYDGNATSSTREC